MRSTAPFAIGLVFLLIAGIAAWVLLGRWPRRQEEGPAAEAGEVANDQPGAEWRVEAVLEQLTERNSNYEVNRLTVVLRDAGGGEIETPDLQLTLDRVPLKYRVRQGNYYDRHPSYRLDGDTDFAFAADTAYELAVLRKGGPASPLAIIQTPRQMSAENFRIPATHPRNRDLVISWGGLRQPVDFLVYRTLMSIDESGNQTTLEGGPYAEDAIRQSIGSGEMPLHEGRYAIPAAYLATSSGNRVMSIAVEITSSSAGKFLYPVLKRSIITAQRKIVLRVDVVDASPQ